MCDRLNTTLISFLEYKDLKVVDSSGEATCFDIKIGAPPYTVVGVAFFLLQGNPQDLTSSFFAHVETLSWHRFTVV